MSDIRYKFIEQIFHSHELIPFDIAKKGKEEIVNWKSEKYWIKDGMEVAHRDNPTQKMWVEKVLKEKKKIGAYESTSILGVKVHWYEQQ